jgi:DNA-binding NarL/FixJ family response regulator
MNGLWGPKGRPLGVPWALRIIGLQAGCSVGSTYQPISVLVVDDDYYTREATRSLLSRDQRTRLWGVSSSTDETRRLLKSTTPSRHPHVVLHDIHLAESCTGIDAIPEIKEMCPKTRVLVMSMDRTEDVIVRAVQAGADGYIWKNESADGLASAVVETAAGRFVVTRSIAERILGSAVDLHGYATEILPESHPYRDLTACLSETMHLYCICGMSAKQIAEELQVSVNTVYSRIKTAYDILDARTREIAFQRFVERTESRTSGRMV